MQQPMRFFGDIMIYFGQILPCRNLYFTGDLLFFLPEIQTGENRGVRFRDFTFQYLDTPKSLQRKHHGSCRKNASVIQGDNQHHANASDIDGQLQVEFFIATPCWETDTSAPYSFAGHTLLLLNCQERMIRNSYWSALN